MAGVGLGVPVVGLLRLALPKPPCSMTTSGTLMFIHLVVHHPKPEHSDDLLASMHRVDAAAQSAPGLIQIGAWRARGRGRLA